MEWEKEYSKSKIHFFSQIPGWIGNTNWECNGKVVLDIGAGDGINSFYLKEKYPECIVISLDISHIRCARCKENANPLVIQGDCCKLPFESSSADFIVCTMVIEHVSDDAALIKEIHRVLKPGGRAFISSVIRKRFGTYFYRNSKGQFMLDPTHVREYGSTAEFGDLFDGSFKIKQLRDARMFFSPARFIYRLLHSTGIMHNPDNAFFQKNSVLRAICGIKLYVPRYRAVEAEVMKNKP